MSIPHLFRCPISLDLFTDPVTLCTGQTYDRHSIEKWFQAGNRTCPVTMQLLYDTSFVPNHNLRHLIEQWLITNPDMNPRVKPSDSKPSPTTDMETSITTIKCILESENFEADLKVDMLKKVRGLSIESDVNQACLIQLGFFPLLLELIFQSPMNLTISNLELLELSLDCVQMLSPSSDLDSLNKILTNDLKLTSLLYLLSQGNAKIKTSLCYLLKTIALSEPTQEVAVIIGQSPHVMRSLVIILRNNADEHELASDACVQAINGLCSLEANRQNAINQGVVHGLINYLSRNSTKKSASSKALETLECLLGPEIEKNNFAKINNLIGVLVKHIFEVSSENEGGEYAVSMLQKMCCNLEWAYDEAISAGVVTQLLLLIQSQSSARAKTIAINLLKLLRLKYRGCD
ncbi:U-box domain-containing protein 25-like [Carex rostrata]